MVKENYDNRQERWWGGTKKGSGAPIAPLAQGPALDKAGSVANLMSCELNQQPVTSQNASTERTN